MLERLMQILVDFEYTNFDFRCKEELPSSILSCYITVLKLLSMLQF